MPVNNYYPRGPTANASAAVEDLNHLDRQPIRSKSEVGGDQGADALRRPEVQGRKWAAILATPGASMYFRDNRQRHWPNVGAGINSPG